MDWLEMTGVVAALGLLVGVVVEIHRRDIGVFLELLRGTENFARADPRQQRNLRRRGSATLAGGLAAAAGLLVLLQLR